MPFYSIALYRGNKGAWLGSPGYYLLTTPERETADLSYPSNYNELGTLIEAINYLTVTTTNDRFAKLPGSIIFSLFDASSVDTTVAGPIIPHVQGPDRVSGMEVFIRSKRYPEKFWTLKNNSVVLSPTRRSKFRIELASNRDDRETLLIADDDVVLTALGPEQILIKLNWHGLLKTNGKRINISFGASIHGGFALEAPESMDNIRYDKNSTCGEDFELV